ncbi:hypothetical protein GDO86_014296 [Hymenochirus boettgeri]|uniref:Uncharacterized protein n=1 Tax=Hymenochirus boettgeri TaxID=247094 RepID=A0A8T2JSH2_9PIPI|nr:hypothetical protein GDO86_014296 [Hymenochirus boettgeri]
MPSELLIVQTLPLHLPTYSNHYSFPAPTHCTFKPSICTIQSSKDYSVLLYPLCTTHTAPCFRGEEHFLPKLIHFYIQECVIGLPGM